MGDVEPNEMLGFLFQGRECKSLLHRPREIITPLRVIAEDCIGLMLQWGDDQIAQCLVGVEGIRAHGTKTIPQSSKTSCADLEWVRDS